MRAGWVAALLVATATGSGCQTAIGNYFANRARDFGECWRAQVRFQGGLCVDVKLAGLVHAGFGGQVSFGALSDERGTGDDPGFGWEYGRFVGPGSGAGVHGIAYFPATLLPSLFEGPGHGGPLSHGIHFEGAEWGPRTEWYRHSCYGLLPCLFANAASSDALRRSGASSGHDDSLPRCREAWWGYRLWSAEALRLDPWSHVHAFDIEVGATVIFLGARVGFSPGEFVDFLLGWFGLDIAGDDRSLPRPDAR